MLLFAGKEGAIWRGPSEVLRYTFKYLMRMKLWALNMHNSFIDVKVEILSLH